MEFSDNNHTKTKTDIVETSGGKIHMNGQPAQSAEPASPAIAEGVKQLVLYENDITDETLSWKETRYQAGTLASIMKRVPMHEPWAPKENLDPLNLKPDKTDREENHK